MVARDNLVAPQDPRRAKRTPRSNGLMAAWLLLIAVVAVVAAWLFANADDTRARWSRLTPSAVVALPTDVPSSPANFKPGAYIPGPGPRGSSISNSPPNPGSARLPPSET